MQESIKGKILASNYPNVALPTPTGLHFVNKSDIIYCLAENSCTHIYLVNGKKVIASRHLEEIEEILSGSTFIIIHDAHLINLAHLTHYSNDKYRYVVMSNGEELEVSKDRKKQFLDRFIRI